MIFKAFIIWFFLMILAILNGLLRNSIISPQIGEQMGHVISTIILCIMILLVTRIAWRWINPGSKKAAFEIGLFWFSLTVLFEFVAGHYLFGNSWGKLFADYNVFRGRVWLLVLITAFFAPVFVQRLSSK